MQQSVRRWDPWRELAQLQNEVNRLFQRQGGAASRRSEYPPVNIWHRADSVTVVSEIPGVNAEDLDITVHGETVTIRGKRASRPQTEGEAYLRRERYTDEFTRTVELPYEVDPQRAEATYENGVLKLVLHRPEEHKPRKVAIRKG